MSTTLVTAGQVMDRVANLLNDPKKTDYSYAVQIPYLNMAIEEFSDLMSEANSPVANHTSNQEGLFIIIPAGIGAIIATDAGIGSNWPVFPTDLIEIQEIAERPSTFPKVTTISPTPSPPSSSYPFTYPNPLGSYWLDSRTWRSLPRREFSDNLPIADSLLYWSFERGVVIFNPVGATIDMEIRIRYISQGIPYIADENTPIRMIGSRTFLAYKTAALCAFFIGENETRAKVLEDRALESVDRTINISNKGRQQIMTRHRPFRAAFKARGGY